jgi:hypothetical protein
MSASRTNTKKKTAKKAQAKNAEPKPADDGPPIPASAPAQAAVDLKPEAPPSPPVEDDAPVVGNQSIDVPLCEPVVLNMRGQVVPPGQEASTTGGKNTSKYTTTIHLSTKQRIGLHRLRVGLNASSELVEMPSLRGRKEVTSDADAIRWLLEQVA